MPVCIACGTEDRTVDNVSELCRSCRDDLGTTEGYPEEAEAPKVKSAIVLTTEASSNLKVSRRLGIVTAECVIGQHIFKDIAAGLRDFFGGRSKVMQNGLKDARSVVLSELEEEAAELGADAVVAVQFHYASVGGAGTVNMLLLTATGTAVKLSR